MRAIVIGCGRVGAGVARELDAAGWDVTAVDSDEDSLGRLGEGWTGGFVVGHGFDEHLLKEAGIEQADAVVVATNGDNTNIIVAQVAKKLFDVPTVVARILDPARAEFYAGRGVQVVCPTSDAIRQLVGNVRAAEAAA